MQGQNSKSPDVVVIGGGLVGSAIAYGLAGRDMRVCVLDGGDRDFRAAHANVGLVWLQGKGMGMPAYQQWTRDSIARWSAFSVELGEATGVDLQYEQKGGLTYCLGEAKLEEWRSTLWRLHNQLGGAEPDWEIIDRSQLEKLVPRAKPGPEVAGASFGRSDGTANPLRLLRALHAGVVSRGGELRGNSLVRSLRPEAGGGFVVELDSARISTKKVVIAAGLGTRDLAAQVGMDVPVRPQRGQVLVTERLDPFLDLPLHGLRQTREGTVIIGSTHEEAGYDTSTTASAAATMSANALRWIPALRQATLVRQWSGLRTMTPDRHPIYSQAESHPGVYVAACHSGVTLAAQHASVLAEAIAGGDLPPLFDEFHQRRFDVPKAA